jgi:carbon-monoxide dehydrogenase small subunit
MIELDFIVNEKPYHISVADHRRLLDILREELGLTGTKEGCGIGECGACTVIMNGLAVNSCLILADQLQNCKIETVENLADNKKLSLLQQKFIQNGAIQCGFCTPGMLMSVKALLDNDPNPDESAIRTALEGNLCRCTGYLPIINAVRETILCCESSSEEG